MTSRGDRMLKRSRHVSSFPEESTESATPSKTTVNVVVDVHNEGEHSQRDNECVFVSSDEKEAKQSERSDSSKSSSRRTKEASRDRHVVVTRTRLDEKRDRITLESFDLIEEIGAPERNSKTPEEIESFPEVKPRRRKQWSTVNVASEAKDNPRKQPRKRWSKDTSVIRLPETRNASPLVDNNDVEDSRKPVPAPRSSVRRNAFFFDNPAFVSENEEVLRIETDHRRESTKIEMRRMSDRYSNGEDVEETRTSSTSSSSLKKNAQETRSKRERLTDSDPRSARTSRSSGNRKYSSGENSSSSLGKVTDIQSNSITYEETSMSNQEYPEATQDRSLRKKERSLFKKKDALSNEDKVSSSAKDVQSVTDIEADTRTRKKKKKKRKQGKENKDKEKEKSDKHEEAVIKYISVTIHRTDLLEPDYANAKRPMVKVHIVDVRTGNYLRNMDNCENTSVSLQPMITGKFDFKENRSMIPVWEEELIFEHDFNAITRRDEDGQVVILFEVIDPLSFAEASFSYNRFGSEGCWNKIAWAFLKPLGCNDTLHTDKKIRLQLYKPRRSFKKYDRHKCEVYAWWQSNNRDKYPSSLFVTVTSVSPPKVKPVLYRQLAMKDVYDTRSNSQETSCARTSTAISLPKWARLAAQSCKIPNEKMFETEMSENGCFYVAFSSEGKYLACVHSEEYNYPIVVYEVATGKTHVRFLGHKSFVYSLNWSSDDHSLLSASADQTARIWDVHNRIVQQVEILPHPAYVYCAKYGPDNTMIVATGCYDHIARVWANDKRSRERVLCQELKGHEGFVNSVAFQSNSDLITADSVGMIIVWLTRRNAKMPSKREWCIARRIKVREIEGVVINTIALHPLESRLLVHSRNSGLRMLDLATGVVLQRYDGLNNQKIQTKACISPCGSLVFCGGEDSVLNVWHLETGEHLAKYRCERDYRAVTCVDYHPYDHVMAYSGFGGPTAIRVLRFNKDASNNDVNLTIMTQDSRNQSVDRNHRSRSTSSPKNAQLVILNELSKSYASRLSSSELDEIGLQATINKDFVSQRKERNHRDLCMDEAQCKMHHWPESLRLILIGSTPNVTQQFSGNVQAAEEERVEIMERLRRKDVSRISRSQRHRSSEPSHSMYYRNVTNMIGEMSGSETSRGSIQNRYSTDTRVTSSTEHKDNVETRHSPRRLSADVIIDVDLPNLEQISNSDSSPRSDGTFIITRKSCNEEA